MILSITPAAISHFATGILFWLLKINFFARHRGCYFRIFPAAQTQKIFSKTEYCAVSVCVCAQQQFSQKFTNKFDSIILFLFINTSVYSSV